MNPDPGVIVSGFPGVGKTYCCKNAAQGITDSDSSQFSWISDGVRHPNFPGNYIEHIREQVQKASAVLVSSHKAVRQGLVEAALPFVLVFPERGLRDEYLQRFLDRGSDLAFVDMIGDKWDEFMADLSVQQGCTIIRLKSGEFLSDVLPAISGAEALP